MKKVAIYNRYLSTAGGGEKYMGVIAEYFSLKKDYQVDIICHEQVDLVWLSERLNINLSKCNLLIEPTGDDFEITKLSEQYDIFVNNTVYSQIQPRASVNCIVIFFPIRFKFYSIRTNNLFHTFGKKIVGQLTKYTIQILHGQYAQESVGEITGFWTKKSLAMKMGLEEKVKLHIKTQPFGPYNLTDAIKSVRIGTTPIPFEIEGNLLKLTFKNDPRQTIEFIFQSFSPNSSDSRELGIFISSISFAENTLRNKLVGFSNLFAPLQKHFDLVDYLTTYDAIWTISDYTNKWFEKIWKKKNSILYPIVDSQDFSNNEEKRKIILSVGRFFDGDHNKKHIPMIKTFKKMVDEGLVDWEYHLCGGTHKEEVHQNYLNKVKGLVDGYPIYVHNDIPFAELKQRYATASIFWHASGYGEDENKHPDKFEHFGITTVEAMAAGCIPVVINKAGQQEIIEDEVNGYLWDTLSQLQNKTKLVINLEQEKKELMRKGALKRANRYNRNFFYKTLDNENLSA